MRKLRTILTFECDKKISAADLREYIKNALESWGGERHPDDPLFNSLNGVHVGGFAEVRKLTKICRTPLEY